MKSMLGVLFIYKTNLCLYQDVDNQTMYTCVGGQNVRQGRRNSLPTIKLSDFLTF